MSLGNISKMVFQTWEILAQTTTTTEAWDRFLPCDWLTLDKAYG